LREIRAEHARAIQDDSLGDNDIQIK
jgi:hypothetical protein